MANKVLVYIDQFKGSPLPASWEALGAGRTLAEKLGGGIAALVIGEGAKKVASQAFQYGADEVFYADNSSLQDYRPEPYTTWVARLAKEQAPEILVFPTTTRGRELAAMSAIDLQSGVLADVIALELDGGKLVATRPVYAGKLLSKVICEATPQIITTRGRAFDMPQPDASRTGEPRLVEAAMPEAAIASRVVGYAQAEGGVSLGDAAVIVSGGAGSPIIRVSHRRPAWMKRKPKSGAPSRVLSWFTS